MKTWKKATLGVALACTLWFPGFANGFDEVNQVSQDFYVAYTLYAGMPVAQAEATFDSLPDWKKKVQVEYGCGPATYVTYTRVLQDKTKQKVYFCRRNDGKLLTFEITIYAHNKQDSRKMYEMAVNNLRKIFGEPSRSDDRYTKFTDSYGRFVSLSLSEKEGSLTFTRAQPYL